MDHRLVLDDVEVDINVRVHVVNMADLATSTHGGGDDDNGGCIQPGCG